MKGAKPKIEINRDDYGINQINLYEQDVYKVVLFWNENLNNEDWVNKDGKNLRDIIKNKIK